MTAMKAWKALVAALALAALLAAAAPAGAEAAAAFRKYVACGTLEKAKPSHVCPRRSKKGAFFRSNLADVNYSVCVRFPTGKSLCARSQKAEQGTLYVNKITSTIPGKHRVTWFVKGKRVGAFYFRVKA